MEESKQIIPDRDYLWQELEDVFPELTPSEEEATETDDPSEDVAGILDDAYAANKAFDAKNEAEQELKFYEKWGRTNKLGVPDAERDREHRAGIAERIAEVAGQTAVFRFYAGFPPIESLLEPKPATTEVAEPETEEEPENKLIVDKRTGMFRYGNR